MAPTPGRSSIGVRVRPNANDFIKDLERQLATKKKTFYVDVHAKTTQATKDVQEWARTRLKAIPATVNVGANTSPATRDMQAWRATQRNIKTNVPIGVDTTKALTDLLAFRRIASKDVDINLRVNSASAAKAAERFQQALSRRAVDVPIDVNDAQIRRTASKIDTNLIRRLQNQGGVILDVDADTSSADASIRSFSARTPRVESELELDLKRARLDLMRLRAEAMSRKLEMRVDIDRSGMQVVNRTIGDIEKRLGNFNFIRSLDFGPVNLGKPSGLVGTLTTITALASAVPAAVTGAAALADALMRLAGAAAIVPGAIGGIMATIGTFSVGISGMSDAFDALQTMWTETPAQAASSARRSVQAHNQLRQAVREEAQAQRDVGAARREATNDLRNLNNELRGSVLNEAQAILDLQKARDRLAKGGFETSTDLKQAQLDEAKAVENLITVRERNGQLQQKVNDENAKGVEGSDKVQDALERQTRASEQAAMALEAIASTQATSALGKFQQELEQLTPNARDFVMTIAGMKGEFEGLRNAVQEIMFAGTGPGLRDLFAKLLPTVGPGMQGIAQQLNRMILQVFDTLGSSDGIQIIDRILEGTESALSKMPALIDPLIRGIGTLMAAGAEHLPQLVDLFTRLADRFANFIENADKTGKLDEFMDRGVDALGDLVELGVNLLQIIDNLGAAFGGDLLQSLVDVTQQFEDWLGSAEGQAKINEYIEQAKQVWEDWKPILKDLPGIFEQVSQAARNVLGPMLSILDTITSFLAENPTLVSMFVTGWLGAKVLIGAASPIVQFAKLLAGIVSAAKAVPGLLKNWRIPGLPGMPGVGPGGAPTAPRGPGIAPVLGGAGIMAAGTLAVTDIFQRISARGEMKGAYDEWMAGRASLTDPAQKRELDAQVYKEMLGIDLGSETVYPLIPAMDFKGFYQDKGRGERGDSIVAHDGSLWYRDAGGNERELLKAADHPAFFDGGFTDWGVQQGRMAVLHGKEFVQPHETVAHYGVEAMEALRRKRIPKEVLSPSFWPGGLVPPLQPLGVGTGPLPGPAPAPTVPTTPVQHGPPVAGATPVNPAPVPGLPGTVGPSPGPVASDPLYAPMDPSHYGPMGSTSDSQQQKLNIFGLEIPIGQADPTRGWGPGGPPVGLGGGDGFDIRRFGIGPGPVGSGPADWMSFAGNTLGNFLTGTVSALGRGFLGFFGLEGVLGSPYFQGATGLLSHFLNPDQTGVGVQAPGADATNAAVDSSLNTYYNMPLNPASVNVAPMQIPQAFDETGKLLDPSSAGLQANTLRGKQIIEQMFPWAKGTIGGVRPDRLKWHPSGLALDLMTDPGLGNNDSTPEGLARGDQAYQWLNANKEALGIDYLMWKEKDHFNHIHVNFSPSGPATPGAMAPFIDATAGGVLPYTVPQVPSTGIPGLDELNAAMAGGGGGPQYGPFAQPTPGTNFYKQWYPGSGGNNGPIQIPRRSGGKSQTANAGIITPYVEPPNGGKITVPLGRMEGAGLPITDPEKYKENLKRMARQLYLSAGMPPAEWPAFERLIQKESSWDPTAKNPTSTAYGLGQFLDTTDAQYGPRTDNPFVQLPRIFQYIRDRYNGSPAKALQFHNKNNWYDRGGWLMPGQSTVDNATGKPELVVPWDDLPGFFSGGLPTGAVQIPRPRPPLPRPPDANKINPPSPGPNGQVKPSMPTPRPTPPPVATPPPAALPPIDGVTAPHVGVGAPPGPTTPTPAPTVAPAQIGTGPGVQGATESHLHPAISKGINSAASTIGSLANTAVAIAAMGATAGASGGMAGPAAGAAGAAGGGMGGLSVGGLIQQGGKIIEDIANVGASFLVGTLTNGTTENPYGVTQRGSNPTGGTRIVDNSTKYGDVYTQDQDEWFRRLDLREAQKAQANLGGYDRYA